MAKHDLNHILGDEKDTSPRQLKKLPTNLSPAAQVGEPYRVGKQLRVDVQFVDEDEGRSDGPYTYIIDEED